MSHFSCTRREFLFHHLYSNILRHPLKNSCFNSFGLIIIIEKLPKYYLGCDWSIFTVSVTTTNQNNLQYKRFRIDSQQIFQSVIVVHSCIQMIVNMNFFSDSVLNFKCVNNCYELINDFFTKHQRKHTSTNQIKHTTEIIFLPFFTN